MSRVVHFEIGAVDTDKIIKFYKDVFDWKFTKFGGPMEYWTVVTGDEKSPGISGGIFKSKGEAVTTNIIGVDNIDNYVKKIESNGGIITVPKMVIPGVGWLSYFKDVEGNLLGVIQPDSNAK